MMAQRVVLGLTTNLKLSRPSPWKKKMNGTFGESSLSFFFIIDDNKLSIKNKYSPSVLRCKGNLKIAGSQNDTMTTESVASIDCRANGIPSATKITTTKGLASLVNNSIISPLYE